jgi:uncharacterized membrane protein YbhN (UPF0104 family)
VTTSIKGLWVGAARLARGLLAATGLLGLLDRAARRSRTLLWVRTWLSIYDLADLARFDVPWWTFEAADAVDAFLRERPGARVFEWGAGASTLWLARRAGTVTSVEHDADWAASLEPMLPDNAAVRLVAPGPAGAGAVRSEKPGFEGLDFGDYVAAIDDVPGDFDLIVVDGRARAACLDRALTRVTPGGIVVLDNVERARYRAALERHPGLSVRWTGGRTPALPYPSQTALVSPDGGDETTARRPRTHPLVRWGFVAVVLAFVGWGFRDHGDDVLDAVRATSPAAVLAAGLLVLLGLHLTSIAWLGLLGGFGHRLTGREGRAVFFVGQLGKYIPGAVWSMGAHAQLARRHDVPVRVTVSTSLTFLWLNLATAGLVVGAAGLTGVSRLPVHSWLVALGTLGCLVALTPPVLTRAAEVFSAGAHRPRLSVLQLGRLVLLMAVTWTAYAAALVALAPDPEPALVPVAAGAFALAYAAGVVVVLAPAGVGVRELTLIALLAPAIGLAAAGAVAILTRLLHTGGDLLMALLSWLLVRGRRTREDGAGPGDLYDTRASFTPSEGRA